MFKKKKAEILLRDLEYIYKGSKYKEDYAYFIIKRILEKKQTREWILFNGLVRIVEFPFKGKKKRNYQKERILQVLEWLGIWYWDFSENEKIIIQITNEINWNYKSKKVTNY